MAFQWVYIGNLMGPPGDPAAVASLATINQKVAGLANNTLLPRLTLADWAHVFEDRDGWVQGGIKPNGDWVIPGFELTPAHEAQLADTAAGLTRSDKTRWAAIGDSLTQGFDVAGGVWPAGDSWPAKLQAVMPAGVSVFNRGLSGYTVDELAVTIGAIPWVVTGTIPASGAGTMTSPAVIGWRGDVPRSVSGTLEGIPGTMTWTNGTGAITFTRTTAGTAKTVTGSTFKPAWDVHRDDSAIIFLGRNDVANNTTGPEATVVDHVVAGVGRIVDYLESKIRQVIIVSVTTTTAETSGTAGYATVTGINARLAANWGGKFLDLRHYLAAQCIYDLGITPTTADLDAMAADTLPPSIMADNTHYTKEAAAMLTTEQIHPFITRRDWV